MDQDTDPSIPNKYIAGPIRALDNLGLDDDDVRWLGTEDEDND
jgi:hypothetical protein